MSTFLRHRWWQAVVVLAALALARCSGSDCVDVDGDGFGEGCALGPDCDDTNQARNERCEGPPPDCEANPTATGCPCLLGTNVCFDGPPEAAGVGLCVTGLTACVGGFWGVCEGGVDPTVERCDGADQDCDGRVDEGALSPCGGCTPDCIGGVWGEGSAPFDSSEDPGLALTPSGRLTLRAEELLAETVWVANSGEGPASRVSAQSFTETGRYTVGPDPSRVAVDFLGDGYVLSRNFAGVGELHRIAGEDERCIDRDGSDSIETSRGSELVENDECVLFSAPVGDMFDVPRALAIDGNLGLDQAFGGDPWVGLHDGQAILHLSAVNFEVLERFDTPGFEPYAFAFDERGTLWGLSRDGLLLSINRFDPAREVVIREIPLACFEAYGLAIDGTGQVVVTGFGCDSVTVYDPVSDRYRTTAAEPSVRGAVAEGTEAFVAHTQGAVSFIDTSTLLPTRVVPLMGAFQTIGIGLTSEWVVAINENGGGEGIVSFLDRATGEFAGEVRVGFAPHTQGDLTGAKRRGAFVESAVATHVFTGCGPTVETQWRTLRVFAERNGGRVGVRARRADTEDALAAQPFIDFGEANVRDSAFPVDFDVGGVVEVELTLERAALDAAPVVERVGFEWTCGGPI
ncbi:MAG: hypothetical protein AAF411_02360 [Myxococcota bacterium]